MNCYRLIIIVLGVQRALQAIKFDCYRELVVEELGLFIARLAVYVATVKEEKKRVTVAVFVQREK